MTTRTSKSLRRTVLELLYVSDLPPRKLAARIPHYEYNNVIKQVSKLREDGLVMPRSQEPDLDGSRLVYRLTDKGRAIVETYQDGPRCPHCGGRL